jgi:hypothetical protein
LRALKESPQRLKSEVPEGWEKTPAEKSLTEESMYVPRSKQVEASIRAQHSQITGEKNINKSRKWLNRRSESEVPEGWEKTSVEKSQTEKSMWVPRSKQAEASKGS